MLDGPSGCTAISSAAAVAAPLPVWEPPVDVLETEREVLVSSRCPASIRDRVEAVDRGRRLSSSPAARVLPPELRTAVIHRLELPQGRFERRIPLPPGRYGRRAPRRWRTAAW